MSISIRNWSTREERHLPSDRAALIELSQVSKSYPTPAGEFTALKELDVSIRAGEFVAVVGRSGSGKSTLLNLLAGIDRPTGGMVWVAGTPVHALDENQVAIWRGRNVGVVFQFFQLLPTLTVKENVMLPMDFANTLSPARRWERVEYLLDQVGVLDQADKLPAALSGGQQQRAAIARAMANDPPILVADEPTGNLDSGTAEAIIRLFRELAAAGKTVVMVTHERDLVNRVDRTIRLVDGTILTDQNNALPNSALSGNQMEVRHG